MIRQSLERFIGIKLQGLPFPKQAKQELFHSDPSLNSLKINVTIKERPLRNAADVVLEARHPFNALFQGRIRSLSIQQAESHSVALCGKQLSPIVMVIEDGLDRVILISIKNDCLSEKVEWIYQIWIYQERKLFLI